MQITPFGAMLLPFAIWAFFVSPGCLFPLAVFLSTFDAASVINVRISGDLVGLRPYYFLALLLIIRFAGSFGEWVQFVRRRENPKSNCARVLIAFWAVVTLGSVALPKLFAGIGVLDPRMVGDAGLAYVLLGVVKPLSWTYRNITQPFFLGIDVVLVVWAGAAKERSALVRRSVRALKAAVAVAALAVFLQFVSDLSGNWFPYRIFTAQVMFGFWTLLPVLFGMATWRSLERSWEHVTRFKIFSR
jgi:hypothetical protein